MFQGQTFEAADIGKVGALLVLEALLSADNALILAILVRHLPKDQQRKALFYGVAGAVVLRSLAIFLVAQILNFWWLQLIGALYLLFLPIKHFVTHANKSAKVKAGAGFWMTVLYVELTDIAFAVDSVLVAVAVVSEQSKMWVIFAGAIMGIVLLRFAANWCLRLMEKYPVFDHLAYALVGWAGIKLLFVTGHTFEKWFEKTRPNEPVPIHIPEMSPAVFWSGMAIIVIVGSFIALRKPADVPDQALTENIEFVEEPAEEPDAIEPQSR